MAETALEQALLKKNIISKLHFQMVGALWRCADRHHMQRAEELRGASFGLFPIGWGITPSEAYQAWQHWALEKWLKSDEADYIGRAKKGDTARLKLVRGKWLCAGGWSDLRFLIQAEGDTALEAYGRWKEKSRADYLSRLVGQPRPELATSNGLRLATGFVSIVIGIALLLWAAMTGFALSTDQCTRTQDTCERSANP